LEIREADLVTGIQFGETHLITTPIGLGLAALGRPGYINLGHADDLNRNYDMAAMEANAHAVLDAAWEAGVRYFDAARSYGRAEAFLSTWLRQRQIDPADVTIGSKWGYTYTADWQVQVLEAQKHEVKDHSLPVLQRQIKESKALLGNYLDLYQIHSATLDSGVLENEAILAELARWRNQGLAIGFSVSGPRQADTIWRALEIAIDGELLFSAVQATWNLLEQSATEALQAAHEAGLGVIIKEALANGRLTPRNRQPDFQASLALLQERAETLKTTIDALSIAAVIQQPFVGVVLSGAARIDHVQSNLNALQVTWDDSLPEILFALRETAETYWHTRSQLAWN
jgi:aryl-alcohol dehydrogenase-like predicted oxidoreductase